MIKMLRFSRTGKLSKMVNSSFDNIFSPMEFKALIKKERTRSDRNGGVFSIVVLEPGEENRSDLEKIIINVSQVTRSIDSVGWDAKGRIAVLLPDTVRRGADIFVNKLKSEVEELRESNISFDIYSYPEHWLTAENEVALTESNQDSENFSIRDSIEFLFVNRIPLWKRILDVSGATVLLVLASPVFAFVCCYIKLISPGPIFFKQTRVGYKGIPFVFWKFRTMKYDNNQTLHGKHAQSFIANGDIPMLKLDDRDPRIIFGGKVLRKSCLDELPQLWNVIRGEMSLVGPRPCIPYEAKEYLRWHTHRFDTLPGLSGLWQVSGKNKLTFKQMVRLDISYCKKISLFSDISIIIRTPFAILKMMFESTFGSIFRHAAETSMGKASHMEGASFIHRPCAKARKGLFTANHQYQEPKASATAP
jgi:lipopolysaccharide/colanic/teichoic acid biosynthesis glycosyltransferase